MHFNGPVEAIVRHDRLAWRGKYIAGCLSSDLHSSAGQLEGGTHPTEQLGGGICGSPNQIGGRAGDQSAALWCNIQLCHWLSSVPDCRREKLTGDSWSQKSGPGEEGLGEGRRGRGENLLGPEGRTGTDSALPTVWHRSWELGPRAPERTKGEVWM